MHPTNSCLLTHKCGNNYINQIFRDDSSYFSIQPQDISSERPATAFHNIRCRNFSAVHLEKLSSTLEPSSSRYFVFIRHPASFFRSCASYHLRGTEEHCKTIKLDHFDGKTLYEELHSKNSIEEQILSCMIHFGTIKRFPWRWQENIDYLKTMSLRYKILRVEELWTGADRSLEIAEEMSHDGYIMDSRRILVATPKHKAHDKQHSTGEFRRSFFADYGPQALSYYHDNFKALEQSLGYSQ